MSFWGVPYPGPQPTVEPDIHLLPAAVPNIKHLPKLVGIVGYARAGKDSSGAVLAKHYGYERVALADPLKDFTLASEVRIRELVKKVGWEAAKDGFDFVRPKLVTIGTAAREVFGIDFWVRMALERALDGDGEFRPTVFTDIRFLNEADALRAADDSALLLRVDRTDVGAASDFEREVGLIEVDGTIPNAGSLLDLEFEVRRAFLEACTKRLRDSAA